MQRRGLYIVWEANIQALNFIIVCINLNCFTEQALNAALAQVRNLYTWLWVPPSESLSRAHTDNLRQRLWHYYWLSSRACITHNSSNHTIINSTERHLLLWLLRIITDILYKLPGEHFQDPRRTVFKDPLISTILRKWRAPSPPILLLLFLQPYNQHQGLLFPLLLVTYFDYSFIIPFFSF